MSDNRREFYRLELYGEEEIVITHAYGIDKGMLKDVSATGLSFECNYEFIFQKGRAEFKLGGKEFEREVNLIRKKNQESGRTFYAVEFLNFTEKERQILFQTLLKVEAKKKLGRGGY